MLAAAASAGTTSPSSIGGLLTVIGNPCTTEPCLPGMAFAVQAEDGRLYYLVSEGRLLSGQPWRGVTLEAGRQVIVTGDIGKNTDIGRGFFTIDIIELKQE